MDQFDFAPSAMPEVVAGQGCRLLINPGHVDHCIKARCPENLFKIECQSFDVCTGVVANDVEVPGSRAIV